MDDPPYEIDDVVFNLKYSDSVPRISKAVFSKNLKELKKLLSSGCPPHRPDNQGFTSIHCCASTMNTKALKLILKHNPDSIDYLINLRSWEGITPLTLALKTQRPSLPMVKLLLSYGADPNARCCMWETPLHLACAGKGGLKLVRLLVEHGAQVNAEDARSYTPLHVAISKGADADLLKFLIGLSDLSIRNTHKRTPFLEACKSSHTEAVRLFLEIDKNFANSESDVPPLVHSCFSGNLETTQLLIESGADVNCRCKAMVPNKSCENEFILFDKEKFLPIHSSLSNIKVFTLLLNLTKCSRLMELEAKYYSFALFVLVYAEENFYETLLQSDAPNKLKTFDCRVLVELILMYPDLEDVISSKFLTLFKYNFSLTPENVFQSFSTHMHRNVLDRSIIYLYLLARMGVPSAAAFHSKSSIIEIVQNTVEKKKNSREECDEMIMALYEATCNLLSVRVLTLKQLCRTVIRDHIRVLVQSDWLALKMVVESKLPEHLKDFILFQDLKWNLVEITTNSYS